MQKHLFLSLLFLSLLWTPAIEAQSNAGTDSSPIRSELTLESALNEAEHHNATFLAAQAELEIAKAQVAPAAALDNPEVELAANNYPLGSLATNKFESTGNEVILSQKFPFPGKRAALEARSQAQADAQSLRLESVKQLLRRDVERAYWQHSLAVEKVSLLRQRIVLLERLIAIARDSYNGGSGTQSEVFSLEQEIAQLEALELERIRVADTSRAQLNYLIGRGDQRRGEKLQRLKAPDQVPGRIDADSIYSEALAHNPSLMQLDGMLRAAEEGLEYSKIAHLPDFKISLGYTQRSAGQNFEGDDFATARVGLSLPLWRSSKEAELERAALSERERARFLKIEEENSLRRRVRESVAMLNESVAKLELYRVRILPLSEESLQSARNLYASGKMELREALSVSNSRFDALETWYETLAEFRARLSELEIMLGHTILN